MRTCIMLGLAAALAAGQYLETTIDFTPGTEPGEPASIVWNSVDNRVYVGDGDGYGTTVAVIDGATNAKLAPTASGRSVLALLYNPVQNRVYATSEYSDSLAIIDGTSGAATFLRASFGTTDIAWNPNNNCVYSMAYSDSRLDVIDCVGETVVAQVTLGYTPQHIVCGPTVSKVYVSDWNDQNLKVISCATNVVVATIDLGGSAEAVCFNYQNHKAYCALRMDNVVKVIDGTSNAVVATVDVPGRPYDLVYNPRDNRIYAACSQSGYVTVIDGATNAVVASIEAGAGAGAITIDTAANKAWCANWTGNSVTVIDCATLQAETTIAVGRGPVAVGYNPTNGRIYVVNQDDASVSVLRDSVPTGIEGNPGPQASGFRQSTTVVRGELLLEPQAAGRQPAAVLLDAAGRMVVTLQAGTNDVSRLAPGVYFVRVAQSQPVRKILIAR